MRSISHAVCKRDHTIKICRIRSMPLSVRELGSNGHAVGEHLVWHMVLLTIVEIGF